MLFQNSRCSGVKRKRLTEATPDQSWPMVQESHGRSMISRCMVGKTHAQNDPFPPQGSSWSLSPPPQHMVCSQETWTILHRTHCQLAFLGCQLIT